MSSTMDFLITVDGRRAQRFTIDDARAWTIVSQVTKHFEDSGADYSAPRRCVLRVIGRTFRTSEGVADDLITDGIKYRRQYPQRDRRGNLSLPSLQGDDPYINGQGR